MHGVHLHLVLFGLWLGLVHGVAQLASPDGKVRAVDVVVPFTNGADPLGIGLGVIALEMMLATAGSVLVQRRLGHHRWRALHSLGYLSFTLVAAHLLVSGSEVAAAPVRTLVVLAWASVVLAGALTLAPVARLPQALLDKVSSRRRAEEITVAVDPGRCGSFGFCEHEAPGVFALRSDGRLAYRAAVPADQVADVIRAVEVCPARAIALHRTPTTVLTQRKERIEPMSGPQRIPEDAAVGPRRRRGAR
jgi:sulfoxide reductase heme-binding subunit YedZ